MVGDSISDIATARAAGVPVIAVDYGYTETPVGELGPDRVISALSDLPNAVFELLRAGSRRARGTALIGTLPYRRHTWGHFRALTIRCGGWDPELRGFCRASMVAFWG